jgi:hypothetical protein
MQSNGNQCQFFHRTGIKCTPTRIIKLEDDHFEDGHDPNRGGML